MPITDSELETKVTLEAERTGVIEEPPFRILVLADLAGDGERKPLAERSVIEIDRDNFDQTIKRIGTRLELEMKGGRLELAFKELDDLHPDNIFRSVRVFAELKDLRRRLMDEGTFREAASEVRSRFGGEPAREESPAEDPVESAPPPDDLLDAILDKPSGGGAKPKGAVSSDLGRMVDELVRPHLVTVDEDEQQQMLQAVDEATSELMRQIIHHRKFRELEATWRGLFFMVRRTETSSDLKIFVLDATKDEINDNLKSASSLAETVVYRHLIRDAIETPGADPWAVVLGAYAYEPNVDDAAALIRVGKLVAVANAPFISHMRPEVLGIKSFAETPDHKDWPTNRDTAETRLWQALRDQAESQFIGMAAPRFLTRLPYGADTDPLDTFRFEEFAEGTEHDHYAWANPCFAAGQLLAESFAAHRWEMGRALQQDIEGLPVHVYKDGSETVYKPCSEVLLTQTACEKMMEHGLMPLVSYKNTDHVKLARFQSISDTALRSMWNPEA